VNSLHTAVELNTMKRFVEF